MPKNFDTSKLGFSKGSKGSTNNENIIYEVNKNTIKGSYDGVLNPKEALTIRCELEEGYFVHAKLDINLKDYILFLVPLAFLGISLLLWNIFGRNHNIVEPVLFEPPDGLNSLEVGFLYKGKVENKDVTSLLIYLANKGYIKIITEKISNKVNLGEENINKANQKIIELENKIKEEREINPNSKKIKYYENMLDVYKNIDTPIDYKQYGLKKEIEEINSKNNFIIQKLKEYDGDNINEKWFMAGLFKAHPKEVTDSMLYDNFYRTNNRILNTMNSNKNRDKIFLKTSFIKKIIKLMMILSYIIITAVPIFTFEDSNILILLFALIFPGIIISIVSNILVSKISFFEKIYTLIFGILFGGVPWIILVFPSLSQDYSYMFFYILGVACLIGMSLCLKI